VIVIATVMETFCSCVIVICNKIDQITITFVSNNYTEFEKTQKSKTFATPSMWPTTTPQSLSGTQHDRTHGSQTGSYRVKTKEQGLYMTHLFDRSCMSQRQCLQYGTRQRSLQISVATHKTPTW